VAWAMVAERFGSKDALLDFVLAQYYERRLVVTPVSGSSGLQQVLAPINARHQPEYHWSTATFGEQKRRSHRRAAAIG
jgi:hypothetical protein